MKQAVFVLMTLLFTSWSYAHEDQQSNNNVQPAKLETSMFMAPAVMNTLGVFITAGIISCICCSYFIWRCLRIRNVADVVFDDLVPDAEIRIHEQLPPPLLFRTHTQPPHPLGTAENV